MHRRLVLVAAGLATLLVTDLAAAAPPAASEPQPPAGTASKDPASTGSTELAGQGSFGQVAAREEEPAGDALEWDLSFGALLSTGNAKSAAITGGSTFRVRRDRHQLFATFLGNYGRASVAGSEPIDTVGNLQGRLRYDLFLGDRWSLFGMVTARHDPFQRLDLRLNVDPGAAFYVINEQKEQLRVEAGYDYQFDVRDPDTAIAYETDGTPVYDAQGEFVHLPRTRTTHAARLFAGYTNKRNDAVGFSTGLEYLQSLVEAQRWRLNWDTSLSTLLLAKLSLAATFTLRLDNDPLPRVKHLDTLSSINLVYRFF